MAYIVDREYIKRSSITIANIDKRFFNHRYFYYKYGSSSKTRVPNNKCQIKKQAIGFLQCFFILFYLFFVLRIIVTYSTNNYVYLIFISS